jgi:hypothetical protein
VLIQHNSFDSANGNNSSGGDVIIHEGDTAWITAEPQMPQLEAKWAGAGTSGQITWSLDISYQADPNIYEDTPFPPKSIDATQSWNIYNDFGPGFFGGDATLSCTLPNGSTTDRHFKIFGKNPTKAISKAYVKSPGLGAPWFAWAIVQEESNYRQFSENDGTPYQGINKDSNGNIVSIDWGMGQLNDKEPVYPQEIWHWQSNLKGAVMVMAGKAADASTYFDAIKTDYPALYYRPPRFNNANYNGLWPDNVDTNLKYNYDPYDVSAITLYNGASVIYTSESGHRFLSCWRFHAEDLAAGDRWEFVTNKNDYVDQVLTIYENGGGPVPP